MVTAPDSVADGMSTSWLSQSPGAPPPAPPTPGRPPTPSRSPGACGGLTHAATATADTATNVMRTTLFTALNQLALKSVGSALREVKAGGARSGAGGGGDEVAHLRVDDVAPAAAAEDAVVAGAGHGQVTLSIGRHAGAQLDRRLRLAETGDVVLLTLDGQQRRARDGLGRDPFAAHVPPSARQQVLLEHDADAVQVVLGRSEEHTSELQSLAYLVCRL